MVDTKALFRSARAKISRARDHTEELKRRTDPLDPKLYKIANSDKPEPQTVLHKMATRYRMRFEPTDNIPDVFAGIIGDAFNNLREALDYAAASVVDTWGHRPKGPLYFPATERKDLKGHTGCVALENALPGFGDSFLKEIRPENGANEHLWEFYKLQRDQKHNDFVPLVTLAAVENLYATVGTNRISNFAVTGPASRAIGMIESDVPIKLEGIPRASVEVRFARGTVFDGELVVPTIEAVLGEVSRTIEWLADFARKNKMSTK